MNIWLEIFGYIGSALVVVSLLMASVVKLRIINTLGSVISGTYALIIGSFPLALMNISLIIINLYYLYKLLKTKQQFEIVKATGDDAMVKYFVERNGKDIEMFFPGVDVKNTADEVAYVVCCNGNVAGMLLGNDMGNGVVDVILDYSVPAYRDCSVGDYLYKNLGDFGVNKLMFSRNKTDAHVSYLMKMGFEDQNDSYIKKIG